MFLRRYNRTKDGKTHTYYALVESVRTEAGPRQRVIAADAFNFTWNGQTHGLSLYSFCRMAAMTCPSAIPPSFGGTRWCQ